MNHSTYLYSIVNTLLAIFICLAVAIPIGSALAILTARSNAPGRRLANIVLASQLAVPLYVFAGGWAAGIGLQGWLQINHWLGPNGAGWMQSWFGSLLAVSLIHALACIPWVSLILSMGLMTCDRSEEDLALIDGGWSMLIRHVWFPRLRIWLSVACLWCAMGLLTEMSVSNLFMFPTVAELVYMDVSRDTISPLTYVSAVGLCALPVIAIGFFVSRGLPSLSLVLTKPAHHQAALINLGKSRVLISGLMWSLLTVLIGLPILNLVMKAGWTPLREGQAIIGHGWTYRRFIQTGIESLTLFRTEFYWSALLSIGSALTALILSVLLLGWNGASPSNYANSRRWTRRRLVHLAMLFMVAIPGPLVGIWIAVGLNRPGLLGELYTTTLAAPMLAQQFRLLPLAWIIACGLVATIPKQTWDLAQCDGLSRLGVLKTVLAPALWSRFAVASILLMLVSVGELSCSMGVLPPGVTTTSLRLFEILHFGMRHQDSGLCGLLLLLGWLAAILMHVAMRAR